MSRPRPPLRTRWRKCWLTAASLALLLPCSGTEIRAASISYTATNLADTIPGQDLWQFSYPLDGFTFGAGQSFTIFFERSLFTLLQSPPPLVNGGWDLLTVQPDLALGSNGFYDALALQAGSSLVDPFRVNFVWLGTGTPGPQSFTIYDTDFSTLSAGQTVQEAKTPVSLRLFVSGVQIRFETVVGRFYRVEYNDDLISGWQVLIDDRLGDGAPMFAFDAAAAQRSQRFYRIVESKAGAIFLKRAPPNFQIIFETVVGRIYRVEYKDDLIFDGWHVLRDSVLGDGLPAIILDATAALRPRRFYRVVETQPAPP